MAPLTAVLWTPQHPSTLPTHTVTGLGVRVQDWGWDPVSRECMVRGSNGRHLEQQPAHLWAESSPARVQNRKIFISRDRLINQTLHESQPDKSSLYFYFLASAGLNTTEDISGLKQRERTDHVGGKNRAFMASLSCFIRHWQMKKRHLHIWFQSDFLPLSLSILQ